MLLRRLKEQRSNPHFSRQLTNDRPESYLQVLQEAVTATTDLVVCVLTNSRKDRYDALKKYLCLDNPVPSQVRLDHLLFLNSEGSCRYVLPLQMVQIKTLSRQNQLISVATKIGLQINAKLGGEIWALDIPTKTLMVIGIDTYHGNDQLESS